MEDSADIRFTGPTTCLSAVTVGMWDDLGSFYSKL